MNVLEKILEEVEERGNIQFSSYTKPLIAVEDVLEIIRSHMDEREVFEFDFNRVKSFDCQCGRHYVNTYDGGWISVDERLPEEGTYVMCCFDDGTVDVLWQNWKDDRSLLFYADINNKIRKVVAWQPLPKSYKPKKDISAAGTEHVMSRFMKVEVKQ